MKKLLLVLSLTIFTQSIYSNNDLIVEGKSYSEMEIGITDGWYGYIATIVEVIRDENGNVQLIVVIEGHTWGSRTAVDRTNTSRAVWNTYTGTFLGFGEK